MSPADPRPGSDAPGLVADRLLVDARILTMDAQAREIGRGWVALSGERIAALGQGDAPAALAGLPAEDMAGDLLMPGMVNPHAHLAMTLF